MRLRDQQTRGGAPSTVASGSASASETPSPWLGLLTVSKYSYTLAWKVFTSRSRKKGAREEEEETDNRLTVKDGTSSHQDDSKVPTATVSR